MVYSFSITHRAPKNHLPVYDKLGKIGERKGNVHPAAVPGDLFECLDGMCVAPVNTARDIAEDKHFKLRGSVIEVEHPRIGKVNYRNIL